MHTLSDLVSGLQSLRHTPWLQARRAPLRRAATRPVAPGPEVLVDDTDGVDPTAQGCGWFDSSHALLCGLHVTEHASPDTVASHLPLEVWLDLHFAEMGPARALRAH
jgi:hypothetical protein